MNPKKHHKTFKPRRLYGFLVWYRIKPFCSELGIGELLIWSQSQITVKMKSMVSDEFGTSFMMKCHCNKVHEKYTSIPNWHGSVTWTNFGLSCFWQGNLNSYQKSTNKPWHDHDKVQFKVFKYPLTIRVSPNAARNFAWNLSLAYVREAS
jgi:hypothetical protein